MTKPEFKEVQALISKIKYVDRELDWEEKPNNSRFLISSAQVLDTEKRTIEGCSFEAHYRKSFKLVKEKYTFTIFLVRNSVKYRIFQLDVDDWDRITHRDKMSKTIIRGPHYHIGDQNHWDEAEVIPVTRDKKHYMFVEWLLEYCSESNLKIKNMLERPPVQGQLNLGS